MPVDEFSLEILFFVLHLSIWLPTLIFAMEVVILNEGVYYGVYTQLQNIYSLEFLGANTTQNMNNYNFLGFHEVFLVTIN